MVTGRDMPDIRECLDTSAAGQQMEDIPLKNDNIQQDILQYVFHQVEHDPQLRCWSDEHREKTKDYLVRYADGV